MLNLDATIKKFDDISYPNRPTKYSEFISDKNNIVHRNIYEDALNKLISTIILLDSLTMKQGDETVMMSVQYFKKTHKIIEVKPLEFWNSSFVIIISKRAPYTKKLYSLGPYWNWHQAKKQKSINKIKYMDEEIKDWEIIKLDYLKGKATLRSRVMEYEMDVDFDYLDENISVSDDMLLKNTFTSLARKNY